MPVVHIPATLRTLTGGETDVTVSGATLGEVIAQLEIRYPGTQSRLIEGDRLRPGLAVFVNSVQSPSRLSTRIPEGATLYFAPALAGG
jgi:molybdopterin converting factor small subunit